MHATLDHCGEIPQYERTLANTGNGGKAAEPLQLNFVRENRAKDVYST